MNIKTRDQTKLIGDVKFKMSQTLFYLHPRQRKRVFKHVFAILLRVGVQHQVVHLRGKQTKTLHSSIHGTSDRWQCCTGRILCLLPSRSDCLLVSGKQLSGPQLLRLFSLSHLPEISRHQTPTRAPLKQNALKVFICLSGQKHCDLPPPAETQTPLCYHQRYFIFFLFPDKRDDIIGHT